MHEYPIVIVPADAANRTEPMGSKRKFWFGAPDEPRRLFKYNRPAHGEDWSEKIAAEIAELLQIPHARVELATCGGERGIVTLDFRHGRGALVHGNELLQIFHPDYPAQSPAMRVKEHTVANVLESVGMFEGRPEWLPLPPGYVDPARTFIGYLMLDALITNTDRHHENWGVVVPDHRPLGNLTATLAPTFDHASSLGRELLDEERIARLDGRDRNRTVERYLARAEGRLFENEAAMRGLSPMAAFRHAAAMRPAAADGWLERLRAVPVAALRELIQRVPAAIMSEAARRFAIRMVELNREELLRMELAA